MECLVVDAHTDEPQLQVCLDGCVDFFLALHAAALADDEALVVRMHRQAKDVIAAAHHSSEAVRPLYLDDEAASIITGLYRLLDQPDEHRADLARLTLQDADLLKADAPAD